VCWHSGHDTHSTPTSVNWAVKLRGF
jgi:hypothetical protein